MIVKLTVLSITPIQLMGKDCENVQLVTDLDNGLGGSFSINTTRGKFNIGQRFELTPVDAKVEAKAEKAAKPVKVAEGD